MKPKDARALVRAREDMEESRRRALEHRLRTGGEELDEPIPELIPTEEDLAAAWRRLRKGMRRAIAVPRGPRRSKVLDNEVIPAIARIVYLERVLKLDELDRASLTPRRLRVLSTVTKPAVQTRYGQMLKEGVR